MQYHFETIRLQKRFPLAISRGVYSHSDNLFVQITSDGHTGFGEMSPGKSEGADTALAGQTALERLIASDIDNLSIYELDQRARQMNIPACALAAIDIAHWDLLAKKSKLPLYKLLGLGKPSVPTSVTIGINSPDVVRERIPLILDGSTIKSLKIKLGSPEGLDADQDMFQVVFDNTRNSNVTLRVDANGGWNLPEAQKMMRWLAERGVDYIEQPLASWDDDQLPELFRTRALPIYVDESCHVSSDITNWAHCVDGVNLKLMKCGGITEALRIVAVARAHGLKTMIGCMGESSVSISAGAALGQLFDHIDLDSHLNLKPDPAIGALMEDGIIMPTEKPGHGAELVNA